MKVLRKRWLALIACICALPVGAAQLVVLVDTSTELPVAQIERGALVGGIHKDLAEALANRMGRQLTMTVLPRKRISMALDAGRGDLICLYLPEWLPGRYQWTQPFFPQTELLVSSLAVERPHSLADLSGQAVGTVLGYTYPEFEHALGAYFVRADGPSNLTNLRKLAAGRVRYVATIKALYDYQLKLGMKLNTHPPLTIKQYHTRCAVSENGNVTLAEVDAAIGQLVKEGVINKILTNYQ